jgi:hypothetical protein
MTSYSYKKVGGAFFKFFTALRTPVYFLPFLFMAFLISCGDGDVMSQNVMQQYYAESLNLDVQTTDSIQKFASKLHSYVKHNPEAKSNPYYSKTTSQLHDVVISIKAAEWNDDVYVLIDDSYSPAPQM